MNWEDLNEAAARGPKFAGTGSFDPAFSNFQRSPIIINNLHYDTVEHYFQAMKTLDMQWRRRIQTALTPGKAKVLGRQAPLRPDWEQTKYAVMLNGLRAKFKLIYFKRTLRDFEGPIVEWNTWHDRVWGVCICLACGQRGENLLGKALEEVRKELQGYG